MEVGSEYKGHGDVSAPMVGAVHHAWGCSSARFHQEAGNSPIHTTAHQHLLQAQRL